MGLTKEQYVEAHFPNVATGLKPAGNQIVVQLRQVKKKTSSGLILANDTQDFNKDNTQVGRLVAVGQIAYRHRETGEAWKEGAWAEIGDIVLTPMWAGFRFEVPQGQDESPVVFVVFEDYHIKGVIETNFEVYDKIR